MRTWEVNYGDGEWVPVEGMQDARMDSGCLVQSYRDGGNFRFTSAVPLAAGVQTEVFVSGQWEPETPFKTELRWVGEGMPPPPGNPAEVAAREARSFWGAVSEQYPAELVCGWIKPATYANDDYAERRYRRD